MWPDRVSNPGPLTYMSDALPAALRVPDQKNLDSAFLKIFGVVLEAKETT